MSTRKHLLAVLLLCVAGAAQIINPTGGTGSSTPSNALISATYGGNGNGVTDNTAAMNAACAANNVVQVSGGNFAFTSNYALPSTCSLAFGPNGTLVAAQGVTISNVNVTSAPPNAQLFTSNAGVTFQDTMTRANENPINPANWTVGGGYTTGIAPEAGQIVGNAYEPVTASAAKIAYVLWTGGGAVQNNQCSGNIRIGVISGSGSPIAVVRGSTTTSAQYQLVLGTSAFSILSVNSAGTTQTLLASLPSADLSIKAGDTFQLCVVGTTLTGYLNGGARLSTTDGTIASGFPGMEIFTNGQAITNITVSQWNGASLGTQAPGAVTFAANPNPVLPEWFGAKGNGTAGAGCAGNDDTLAIQQATKSVYPFGGAVYFSPGKVYQVSSALSITSSDVSWRGAQMAGIGVPAGVQLASQINQCGATDVDVLDITGSGTTVATAAFGDVITDLFIERSVIGALPSAGVRFSNSQMAQAIRTTSYQSFYGWYLANTTLNWHGVDLVAQMSSASVTNSAGYSVNGGQNSGVCINCWDTSSFNGFALNGAADFVMMSPSTTGNTNGFLVTGSVGDVHLLNPIIEGNTGNCINDTAPSLGGIVEFTNIYCNVTISTPAVDLESTTGVFINGGTVQGGETSAGVPFVKINGATANNNRIIGVHFNVLGGTASDVIGILISGGASGNVVMGNDFMGTVTFPMSIGVSVTGSSNNTIADNAITGFVGTGFSFDATSNNNQFRGNSVVTTHVTTRTSDAGAGNGKNWHDQGTCTMAAGTCAAQTLSNGFAGGSSVCWGNYVSGTLTGNIKFPSTATTVTPASSVGTDTAVLQWACDEI